MIVAKWGNSLAIRIPVDVVRELELKEGDEVELCKLDDGEVAVISDRQRRKALADRLTALAVPFPPDFRFDRDEATER